MEFIKKISIQSVSHGNKSFISSTSICLFPNGKLNLLLSFAWILIQECIHFSAVTSFTRLDARFVNLMEGHIWLDSEGLGKGCTAIFMVKLGIRGRSNEAKLPYMARAAANHVRTNFPGLKVLLMDDNGLVTNGLISHVIPV